MAYNLYGNNQTMINQLMRQKDNIENMLNQFAQPTPVQNIINTGAITDFEARVLSEDEEVQNILINKRTMFLDKKNKKLYIKEVDGKISEEYEIVIPLDAKDKKILELENRLKEMEEKINVEYAEPTRADDVKQQSNADGNEPIKSTAKTSIKSSTGTIKWKTSRVDSKVMQWERYIKRAVSKYDKSNKKIANYWL